MGIETGIKWADHTFNPWVGCSKVSPACDHCYAEGWAKRSGMVRWGADAPRVMTSQNYWHQPHRWNRLAKAAGVRRRVFCASLADVFDPLASRIWRGQLFHLIDACPDLDWLLLTKRPENIAGMIPPFTVATWDDGARDWVDTPACRSNVWLGTTAENQEKADERIGHLLAIPAPVHFLSCEPLLGEINISEHLWGFPGNEDCGQCPRNEDCECGWTTRKALGRPSIDWVIAGGESGAHARPSNPEWFRTLKYHCDAADVPFFFKQWGEWAPVTDTGIVSGVKSHTFRTGKVIKTYGGDIPFGIEVNRVGLKTAGHLLDGVEHFNFPTSPTETSRGRV